MEERKKIKFLKAKLNLDAHIGNQNLRNFESNFDFLILNYEASFRIKIYQINYSEQVDSRVGRRLNYFLKLIKADQLIKGEIGY